MRHRRRGRVLGRDSEHRRSLFRNMMMALFLTERDTTDLDPNAPKVKGRIITTLEKAKEIRPLVEKCVTIARKGILAERAAIEFGTDAVRGTDEWKEWRKSENWRKWAKAISPAVTARRRIFSMVRDKQAVAILFEKIAVRFMDRPGGYTRIMRLAKPRLGDAGTRAILEFVGQNDRAKKQRASKPEFSAEAVAQ